MNKQEQDNEFDLLVAIVVFILLLLVKYAK